MNTDVNDSLILNKTLKDDSDEKLYKMCEYNESLL